VAGSKATFAIGSDLLRDLSGFDVRGQRIAFRNRTPDERFVAFVMRDDSVYADCSYWESVADRIDRAGLQKQIKLVAFCSNLECAAISSTRARFPVLAFAENDVLLVAQRLDLNGEALEVDRQGRTVRSFRWRGASVASTALRLGGKE